MATLLRSIVVLALILGTFAATPVRAADLVPCGNVIKVSENANQICYTGECTICDTQILALRVLNYLITLGVIIAALLFVNAGVLYVTSPGNSGNIAKAHRIFTSTVVGLIIMLAAWLLIDLIMKSLYAQGNYGPWNEFLCSNASTNGAYCVEKIKGMQVKGGTAPPPGPGGNPQTLCTSRASECSAGTCTPYDTPEACATAADSELNRTLLKCSALSSTDGRLCITRTCGELTAVLAAGCAPPPPPPGGGPYDTTRITSAQARALLAAAGIPFTGTDGPSVEKGVIDSIIALHAACGNCVVVTSLTGGGHSPRSGHYRGIKADLRLTPGLIQYVESNWQRGSYRGGDYPGYNWIEPGTGRVCVREDDHYDCCFNQADNSCT
jgi:hypothetical protein